MAGRAASRSAACPVLSRGVHRCRPRSPTSPIRTRQSSTICCSRRAPRPCCTIAGDPEHLGARIGITSVLHTWGSAIIHHPHVHMIVPGGGLSHDGQRWVVLPGQVLSPGKTLKTVSPAILQKLLAAHAAGQLQFFGTQPRSPNARLRRTILAPLRKSNGTSMPSARSADPRRCWPICRAIPTASPSPTAG